MLVTNSEGTFTFDMEKLESMHVRERKANDMHNNWVLLVRLSISKEIFQIGTYNTVVEAQEAMNYILDNYVNDAPYVDMQRLCEKSAAKKLMAMAKDIIDTADDNNRNSQNVSNDEGMVIYY